MLISERSINCDFTYFKKMYHMQNESDLMQKIVSLCKRRGIIFPSSYIYGGMANAWDYGPIGVELKNNIKQCWWKSFVRMRDDIVGLDSAILMHPDVWKASGHLGSFKDLFVDCKSCKKRYRADHLIHDIYGEEKSFDNLEQCTELMRNIPCTTCSSSEHWTEVREFNMMFSTHYGLVEDDKNLTYLRPETAQSIFINFPFVKESMRLNIPFGIAQIGKSFRNEVTPGHFIFRTREFEQMEIEYFVSPESEEEFFNSFVKDCYSWFLNLGICKNKLRLYEHKAEQLAHYSKKTVDIEYQYPFGFGELVGIALREDFDLKNHQNYSKKSLLYQDHQSGKKYFPHVVEPSFGLDRSFLTFLLDAYTEERVKDEMRIVLKLHYHLAPVKIAIFPLKPGDASMVNKAKSIASSLRRYYNVQYDQNSSIGKLYRRQDEIGTPFCVTVDFNTQETGKVTVRNRDTMRQDVVDINQLEPFFKSCFESDARI